MATRKEFEEWFKTLERQLVWSEMDRIVLLFNLWLSYCEKKGIEPRIK